MKSHTVFFLTLEAERVHLADVWRGVWGLWLRLKLGHRQDGMKSSIDSGGIIQI